MSIEAMKQMVASLSELVPDPQIDFGPAYEGAKKRQQKAIAAGRQAIADLEKQKPVAWRWIPSEVWKDYVLSDDKEKAKLATEHGIEVEPLYTSPPQRQPQQSDFEEYCKTLHPLWNTRISRTEAEGFFHAGWLAAHGIKGK